MAPGIRPRRPLKKGGEGSATGPPATASGAPPAYQDQTSPAGGGAALSGAACRSQSHLNPSKPLGSARPKKNPGFTWCEGVHGLSRPTKGMYFKIFIC